MNSSKHLPEQTIETQLTNITSELSTVHEQSQAEYSTSASNGLTRYIKTGLAVGGATVAGAFGIAGMANAAPSHEETQKARSAQENEYLPDSYISPRSTEYREKMKKLYMKCGDPLVVNQGIGHRRTKSREGTLSVVNINDGKREKFVWKHSTKITLCGIAGITSNGQRAFFPKPTKKTKRGGYFIDNFPDGPSSAGQFSVFLRLKK